MKFTISKAEIKDSETIAALSNQLGYESDTNTIQKRLLKIFDNSDNCVFVASENNKTVGWIHGFYSLRVETDSFIEIGGLVVDQKYRENGIGKLLIDEVIKWSESKNCKDLRVRCNISRTESHIFYQKIGFQINKEQKVFSKKM